MTLAIIAALPRELAPLARATGATRLREDGGVLIQTTAGPNPALLITAGIGAQRVALAVAAALAHGPVGTLLSVGLAGACSAELPPGTVVEAQSVIDSRTGERLPPTAQLHLASPAILVTSPTVAGPAEKLRLRNTYHAGAVDMEAATVARLALAHNIPFAALKAISDDHAADLAHLAPFTNSRGQFRTTAFAVHTALRPRLWRPTVRLGRHSASALNQLTSVLQQLISRQPEI